MVSHGRVELLAHPLSQKYLQMKWNSYGKYFHLANLLIYSVFLLFITIFSSQLMQNPAVSSRHGLFDRFILNITLFLNLDSSNQTHQMPTKQIQSPVKVHWWSTPGCGSLGWPFSFTSWAMLFVKLSRSISRSGTTCWSLPISSHGCSTSALLSWSRACSGARPSPRNTCRPLL